MKSHSRKKRLCVGYGEEACLRRRRGHWWAGLISVGRRRGSGRHRRRSQSLGRWGLWPARLWAGGLLVAIALACLPCALSANPGNAALARPRVIGPPLGAFVKDFHGTTATLSPLAGKLGVVWTVANNGKAVVYASGTFAAGQLHLRTVSGKQVLRKHKYLTAGLTERLAPGASFRVVINLRKYFQIPGRGSFTVTFWNSVWDQVAERLSKKYPGKLHMKLFWSRDIVNLESNALIVKIGPGGKLTWSAPGAGAVPKAVKISPVPRPPARAILPTAGPVATLSALADAVRTANVPKARSLILKQANTPTVTR